MKQNSQSAGQNSEIVSGYHLKGAKRGSRGPAKLYSESVLLSAMARAFPNQEGGWTARQCQNYVMFWRVVDFLREPENWPGAQAVWKRANHEALVAYIGKHKTVVSKLGRIPSKHWTKILTAIVTGDGKRPYSSARAMELIRIHHPLAKANASDKAVMRRRVDMAIKYFRRAFGDASDAEIATVFAQVAADVIKDLQGSSTPPLNFGRQ